MRDLFAPVRGRWFEVVVTNPPYVPAPGQDPARYRMARCWDGGHDGRLLLDRICLGCPTCSPPTATRSSSPARDSTCARVAQPGDKPAAPPRWPRRRHGQHATSTDLPRRSTANRSARTTFTAASAHKKIDSW